MLCVSFNISTKIDILFQITIVFLSFNKLYVHILFHFA